MKPSSAPLSLICRAKEQYPSYPFSIQLNCNSSVPRSLHDSTPTSKKAPENHSLTQFNNTEKDANDSDNSKNKRIRI